MSIRPAIRRLAILCSLAPALADTAGLPITTFVGAQAARADVSVGDIVFSRYTGNDPQQIMLDSGGTITDLSNNTTFDDSNPDVSADGSRIAFSDGVPASNNPSNGVVVIGVMNSDGSDQTALDSLSTTDSTWELEPHFSPDGTQIAYIRQVHNSYCVAAMNADGSNKQTLTTVGQEDSVSWSSDEALSLLQDPHRLYTEAPEGINLMLVQAICDKIWILDTGVVGVELTTPYAELLTVEAKLALTAADREPAPGAQTARPHNRVYYRRARSLSSLLAAEDGDLPRLALERSHGPLPLEKRSRAFTRRHGSDLLHLVGTAGFEPATP